MAFRTFMIVAPTVREMCKIMGPAFEEDFVNPNISTPVMSRKWHIDQRLLSTMRRQCGVFNRWHFDELNDRDKEIIANAKTHKEASHLTGISVVRCRKYRNSLATYCGQPINRNRAKSKIVQKQVLEALTLEDAVRLSGLTLLQCVRIRFRHEKKTTDNHQSM